MIDRNKYEQYGFQRNKEDVKIIVLHNTGNYEMSARDLYKWLNEESTTSQGTHFIIDHNEIIEIMPVEEWGVYHTGKGKDFAAKYGIAIEICSNLNTDKYLQGEQKAMELVKSLIKKYHLTKNDIYFHQDFNNTIHCPNDILNIYGNRKNFINNYINEEE